MYRRLLILLILFVATVSVHGQQMDVRPSVVTDVSSFKPHNPTKALLLSLVPGGGQIYNGQAWKLPIFYGALGVMGYLVYTNYADMKMFKDEYLRIGYNGRSTLDEYPNYPGSSIYNMYQSSNKSFQRYVLITLAVYGVNLLDAYVFGHLYDFQVSDDLSLNLSPSLTPLPTAGEGVAVTPTLNLSFHF
ncbi:MAG: hypothetical protein IKG81_13740 [Bacteroidales bacterium]|nr:hypothetical protein [Bacteroidales bacterium]